MAVETLIRQLLEAGVHFGHQTKRWNPKMKKFIFGARSGVYIIDLQQTAQRLKAAEDFLKELAARGQDILFVGTKKQAQDIVASEATRCMMFYVNQRWLGGTLTNFATVRKSVQRLHDMEAMVAPESTTSISKKEKAIYDKEIARLTKKLSGIIEMNRLPAALVVVDPKKEETAVREAKRLAIPVVGILDTNCDPEGIDYPIPSNDDAIRSIKLLITIIAESVLAGKQKHLNIKGKEEKKTAKKKAKKEEPKETEETEAQAEPRPTESEQELIETVEETIKEPEQPEIRKKPGPEEQRK